MSIKKAVESLKVNLTRDELLAKGQTLGDLNQQLAELANKKKREAAAIKSAETRIKEEIDSISNIVTNKYEYRDVEVTIYMNTPKPGRKTCVRDDTGEKEWESSMSADELQTTLKFEQAEKDEAKAADEQRKIDQLKAENDAAALQAEKDAAEVLAEEQEVLGKPDATPEEQEAASKAEEAEAAHGGDEANDFLVEEPASEGNWEELNAGRPGAEDEAEDSGASTEPAKRGRRKKGDAVILDFEAAPGADLTNAKTAQ